MGARCKVRIDEPPVRPYSLEFPAVMSRVRIFLACLPLLAVPLQGLAAAGMLYCSAAATHSHQEMQASAGHDHSAHVHAADDAADAPAGDLPDAGHKCGACASCCNGVAIAAAFRQPAPAPSPQAQAAEPVLHLHSRPPPAPDKPPRA